VVTYWGMIRYLDSIQDILPGLWLFTWLFWIFYRLIRFYRYMQYCGAAYPQSQNVEADLKEIKKLEGKTGEDLMKKCGYR
jgi:hypothetical protein